MPRKCVAMPITDIVQLIVNQSIGVARDGQRGHGPPKFSENIVMLCFERCFSKQNSVIRLKASILPPPKFFAPPKVLGWLRH